MAEFGPLPTQIDPRALALMQYLHQQSQPGSVSPAAPPASPAAPAMDPQQIAAEAMQRGSQLTEEQIKRGREYAPSPTEIRQWSEAGEIPKTGFFDPGPGKRPGEAGYVAPHRGLGGNIVRSIEAFLAATGPGQAVQEALYEPGLHRYQMEHEARAKELAALQGQERIEYEPVGATARMGPAYMTASARDEQAKASRERADAYVQSVSNRLMTTLKSLNLREIYMGSQMALNDARQKLATAMPGILEARNQLEKLGIDTRAYTEQAKTNVLAQLGMDKTHPMANLIDSLFGTETTPAAPQVPSGARPVAGATPINRPKPKTGGTDVTDPRGVVHHFKDQASADAFKRAAGIK